MKIFAPKENDPKETRASLDPAAVAKLVGLGAEVVVESQIGEECDHPDASYKEAGATLTTDRVGSLGSADIVTRIRKPSDIEVAQLKEGAIHISFLDPFNESELLAKFAEAKSTAISLEMVPRSTLAQKMDAISSQANLAGYVAVITAANRMNGIFPMMMTPAGTISPAKVFVLGIGVAGLQAIATAKRLGARVTAFDVREEALEQAESLGAKALRIDLGETGGTDQGYAKELTPEQLQRQQEAQAKVCAQSDVVITTAKVFGRKPPILIKKEVVDSMQNGSVVVDLAAETGGNVEGITPGEETVSDNGVKLVGLANFEGQVSKHASQVLAANFANMIEHFWDEEKKALKIDLEDEIQQGCVITHNGAVVHERFKD
ncbi:MAG: NAD(P)(+) transhydrogenase (Re/Si-specific) subunit alpha [Verrucomicrobiales bacterium]|jgi:NAD(P) transhydrogenase subunit alpha|nr:NAD(P)(+) transhydrogenase (Re/Si-specific) subunit alpha [Verrucomicrobiales bacterium]|tara:strand:+ start:5061 stop:6188 length:1128 start_codon:yes stop_codon:yes gene_type:complete